MSNLDETVRKREKWIREEGDYKGLQKTGWVISRIVPREKRVSGDPLQPDSTGRKRRQFPPQRLS